MTRISDAELNQFNEDAERCSEVGAYKLSMTARELSAMVGEIQERRAADLTSDEKAALGVIRDLWAARQPNHRTVHEDRGARGHESPARPGSEAVKDERSGWHEADIVINGKALTFAESMSLRVAVTSFRMSLHADSGSMMNELGPIGAGYDEALSNIEKLIVNGTRNP